MLCQAFVVVYYRMNNSGNDDDDNEMTISFERVTK